MVSVPAYKVGGCGFEYRREYIKTLVERVWTKQEVTGLKKWCWDSLEGFKDCPFKQHLWIIDKHHWHKTWSFSNNVNVVTCVNFVYVVGTTNVIGPLWSYHIKPQILPSWQWNVRAGHTCKVVTTTRFNLRLQYIFIYCFGHSVVSCSWEVK